MDKDTRNTLENYKIEPFTLIHDILVNWWAILLGALAAAMIAYIALSLRYIPEYTTSATFVVQTKNTSASYTTLSSANATATTFQKIIESSAMNEILCEKLGVDEIDADIRASVMEGTNLMDLSVTASSPSDAFDIMQGILDNYSSISFYTVGDVVLNELQSPGIAFSPDNPLNLRDTMKKAFLITAGVLVLLFGLLSTMQDTLKLESDVEDKLDAKSLGAIAFEFKYKTLEELLKRRKKALLVNDPIAGFGFVESYRKAASRVEYHMEKEGWHTLAVTSVSENEGKSTVAANLAVSLAGQGKRVILIDGDLRRPSQFLIFGLSPEEKNEIGEFLKGDGSGFDLAMETETEHLSLVGGRGCYSSSTDILQRGCTGTLIEKCRENADFVIVDTPPTAVLGDAELWAQHTDATMFVARQNFIYAEDINNMLDKFRGQKIRILGVVLNGVQSFGGIAGATVGRYSGRYGDYGNYGKRQRESIK